MIQLPVVTPVPSGVGESEPIGSVNEPALNVSMQADTGQSTDHVVTVPEVEVVAGNPSRALATNDGYLVADNEFFSKPILLTTISWTSATAQSIIYPWKSWINDVMVTARLKGRTYIRGTMCLRFDIAAGPYQYGLLRAAFRYGPNHIVSGTTLSHGKAACSQYMGVDLDAGRPGSHILKVPWIFPYDYFQIVGTDKSDFAPVADALMDTQVFGFLVFMPIVALGHANSASSGTVSIKVRAWVEDFQSVGPTRAAIVAQSKVVSGGAKMANDTLMALGRVPNVSGTIVGKLATSAGYVAGAVRDIAALFGFSRERDDNVLPTCKIPNSAYSVSDAKYNGSTLAYTTKRALSKATRNLAGDVYDDMAIARMTSHPSWLINVPWATTDSIGTVLYSIPVDPMVSSALGAGVWEATALAGTSLPFKFWRGTLKFRFVVISSGFHTGMLRICYDPGIARTGYSEDTTWPHSALENVFLEVTPGACVDVEVGYTNREKWLTLYDGFNLISNPSYVTSSVGKIFLMVENGLQAPLSTSGINVAVYIWGGEDYQVFGVRDPTTIVGPAAAVAAALDTVTDASAAAIEPQSAIVTGPVVCDTIRFGGRVPVDKNINTDFFGEECRSLRALLKRFTLLGRFTPTDAANTTMVRKYIQLAFPLYPPSLGVTASPFVGGSAFVYWRHMNLHRHFRLAFVGQRGGIRFRVEDSNPMDWVTSLGAFWSPLYTRVFMSDGTRDDHAVSAATQADTAYFGGNGEPTAIFDGNKLEPVEFEAPDFHIASFHYAGGGGGSLPTTGAGIRDTGTYPVVVCSAQRRNFAFPFFVHFAAADDFSFVHFQGFPTLYDMAA
jgi:hypothetical protein